MWTRKDTLAHCACPGAGAWGPHEALRCSPWFQPWEQPSLVVGGCIGLHLFDKASSWVPSAVTHWSVAVSLPPTPPPRLSHPSSWSPEEEGKSVPTHSGLPFLALTFCSGFWVVRSGPSSSSLGRQPFSALPVVHIVIVGTSIPRETDIFFFFNLLGVLHVVTWDGPKWAPVMASVWGSTTQELMKPD